jgi:hypothetical protein
MRPSPTSLEIKMLENVVKKDRQSKTPPASPTRIAEG